MRHEPAALKRMNKVCPSVIAKDGARVAGYVIMMPRDWVVHFPVLLPMLHKLNAMTRDCVALRDNLRWCYPHACHCNTVCLDAHLSRRSQISILVTYLSAESLEELAPHLVAVVCRRPPYSMQA